MSNTLIKWNTARIIANRIADCAFLYNFPFAQAYADLYAELCTYVANNYRDTQKYADQVSYNDFIRHLDNVQKFQQFVAQQPNDHANIGALAGQLFGNKDLKDGMAVDLGMIKKLEQLLEFAQSCGTMFNYISNFTGYYENQPPAVYSLVTQRIRYTIPDELATETSAILSSKGLLDAKPDA